MAMNRRGFLKGLGAIIAAPAVVKASSLMPIWMPPGAGKVMDGTTRIIGDQIQTGMIISDKGTTVFSRDQINWLTSEIRKTVEIDAATGDATFAGNLTAGIA